MSKVSVKQANEPEKLSPEELAKRARWNAEQAAVLERARATDRAVAGAAALPEVVPHAYALVQDERGGWHALHLEGVTAEKITRLEPNTRPEPGMFAAARVTTAIELRYRQEVRDNATRGRARAKAEADNAP